MCFPLQVLGVRFQASCGGTTCAAAWPPPWQARQACSGAGGRHCQPPDLQGTKLAWYSFLRSCSEAAQALITSAMSTFMTSDPTGNESTR
jgi:hypothetical protein